MENKIIDVAIIGGGPAALGAAIYSARGGACPVIFEKKFIGGQISSTYEIDNYPGFPSSPSGSFLIEKMQEHVSQFNVKFRFNNVSGLILDSDVKKIITAKKEFEAKSVILAMGASPAKLNIPGEAEFTGKGVSYCATCDGMFFKDKTVAVAGGGNTAVEDALYLAPIAKKVYIIHRRDSFRASGALVERLKAAENVELLLNSVVTKASGGKALEEITLKDNGGSIKTVGTDALFVAVGIKPQSSLVAGKVQCDEKGFIITDENMATNIKGVFAAGDIRKKGLRQVITAVSDGAIAAEEAVKYIASL